MLHFRAEVHNCFPLIISPFCAPCILVNGTAISQATPAFIRSPVNDSALPHFLPNKMNSSPALTKACFYFPSFTFVLSVMGVRDMAVFEIWWIQSWGKASLHHATVPQPPVGPWCWGQLCSLHHRAPAVTRGYWEDPGSTKVDNGSMLWGIKSEPWTCVPWGMKGL